MSESGDGITAKQTAHVVDEDQQSPLMATRTRSGRMVRRPSAFRGCETPVTSGRRTRSAVTPKQKEPEAESPEPDEEKPAECVGPETAEEKPAECDGPKTAEEHPLEPEAVEPRTDPAAEVDIAGQLSKPTPIEKVPETPKTKSQPPKKVLLGQNVKATVVVPLGKPKSGRVWKDRNKQRFSALVRDASLCTSWEKKMQAKREKKLVHNYMLELKEQKAKVKEDKRKRREENLKRRAENERKAEIVQVIRNTAKIKRMKKKQLRKIEKRDTLTLLENSKNNNQNQNNNKSKRAKKSKTPNLT
ncbi:coiled-coil domain-containing protein 86 [Syngnathoides biaculeatus]|uniref:coiled-coil domain-containing protein 86 n=1 Tax=Syngnathoides biaculeatus TaxID=300417 RepID=UPI002ADDDEA3|nr:coiled-coil domain-containing protein 86 [Syngnathoides biaculeatus]